MTLFQVTILSQSLKRIRRFLVATMILVQEELVWAKGDLPISSAFTIIQWVVQIERKAVQLILSIII